MRRKLPPWIAGFGIAVAVLCVAVSFFGGGGGGGGVQQSHPSGPVSTASGIEATPSAGMSSDSASPSPAMAPALDEDLVMQGRYVFEKQCMACHGRWGDGRGELAEGMLPKPRRLTSGIFKFRSTPSGFLPTDRDLERTIRGGIANSSMPSFAHLPNRDLVAVITYVKTLSSRWRHTANRGESMVFGGEPDWFYDLDASRPHRDRGGQLFQANCVGCHSLTSSELVDQWGDPCPAPDLASSVLKCGGEATDLFRILATGMDGTPMPSFDSGLSVGDRWDLVAFLRELRRPKKSEAEAGTGDPGEGGKDELPGSK